MRKIGIVLVFIVCHSSIILVKGQDKRLSLAECVSLAMEHNPMLQQSELSLQRDEGNYKQAHYNRLPVVDGNISHAYNEGRSINSTTNEFVNSNYFSGGQSLTLQAPIFNGFSLLYDIRRKASAREAGKFEFEGASNQLKLDVIATYVMVLTAEDMLVQAEGQLAVTEENMKRMELLQQEGAANPGDYHDLKGQWQSEQNNVALNEQELHNSKLRLAALLGMSGNELPELEELRIPVDGIANRTMDLYGAALENLPQFKALDWRIKAAEQGVRMAKSAYYPSLSLQGSINSRFSSVDGMSYGQQFKNYPSKAVSLSLHIPIFNKMATRTQVKLAKLDLDAARWERKIQENLLWEETAKVVFNLTSVQEQVNNLQVQVQCYQEAFRIAQVHFDAGNSNSWVLLTAKNKLDNSRNQLLIKQYEWIMQKYINDYYAGTLVL